MKTQQSYTIEESIVNRLEKAAKHRSKSSIVQEAIALWLKSQEDDYIEGFRISEGT